MVSVAAERVVDGAVVIVFVVAMFAAVLCANVGDGRVRMGVVDCCATLAAEGIWEAGTASEALATAITVAAVVGGMVGSGFFKPAVLTDGDGCVVRLLAGTGGRMTVAKPEIEEHGKFTRPICILFIGIQLDI